MVGVAGGPSVFDLHDAEASGGEFADEDFLRDAVADAILGTPGGMIEPLDGVSSTTANSPPGLSDWKRLASITAGLVRW